MEPMGKNRKGFTLAELLIVVAIIGVLVAVSIPIFTAQKKKAIVAVNQANARSAYAAAIAELNSKSPDQKERNGRSEYYYIYDISTSTIIQDGWFRYSGDHPYLPPPVETDHSGVGLSYVVGEIMELL